MALTLAGLFYAVELNVCTLFSPTAEYEADFSHNTWLGCGIKLIIAFLLITNP